MNLKVTLNTYNNSLANKNHSAVKIQPNFLMNKIKISNKYLKKFKDRKYPNNKKQTNKGTVEFRRLDKCNQVQGYGKTADYSDLQLAFNLQMTVNQVFLTHK